MYIKDDPFASYKLLEIEFKKKGYTITHERQNNKLVVIYTAPSGRQWKTQAAHISYPFTSRQMGLLSINKDLAYNFAVANGVSIPYTYHIASGESISESKIKELLDQYGTLIVKPNASSLSRGLTLNIDSIESLREALEYARTITPEVIIQEQVKGEEVRFVIINGHVQAAILRQTPRLIGNGVSTIAELIRSENKARERLKFPYIDYPQLDDTMIDPRLFTSEDILATNDVLELSHATMIKNGCSVYNILATIDPSYIQTVERLSSTLETAFVVIDMFISDLYTPQTNDNYWFIEFNTSPVLKLFYGCRDGNMFDIVPLLVTLIDDWLHATKD